MSPTIHYSRRYHACREKTSTLGYRGRIHKSMNANGRACAGYLEREATKPPDIYRGTLQKHRRIQRNAEELKKKRRAVTTNKGEGGREKQNPYSTIWNKVERGNRACLHQTHAQLCLKSYVSPYTHRHTPSSFNFVDVSPRNDKERTIYGPADS